LLDVLDTTSRRQRWPELATDALQETRFVLTVARWCAVVLAHIHAHNYVVGDLSPRNVLVYPEGTVAFVDCDSYQVGDGSVYGCGVSTAGYRAPEVRVISEGRLAYSVHSDAFALATIVFRLVCGNYHPYQGVPLTPLPSDTYDVATYHAKRRIWPYDPQQTQSAPPPGMQEYYAELPAEVRAFFLRAFAGDPAQRPTPAEWVRVLDAWLGEVR
jgi:DNA-binding helix-hairpin-helix protein with protein kinase domain